MRQFVNVLLVCLFAASAYASSCTSPKATVTSFSTQDATILTQLAHIGEFTLKCGNGAKPTLFAEFPCGKVVPVAQVGEEKYQVSWTQEIKKSSSGNVVVRLFDEDGYSNLRKVQRDGGKVSSVKSLVDITINTKSAYKGPWVKAELVAALLVGAIAYFAVTTKSKVQA
ncbi:translocon-associated protein subunit delta [Lucilia sericata]|uniref:translocon-associated protein subunit delta n=1 Tax=Lucilia sericata TaxID=13632 RepID=UPI0018A83CDC|nr:translocon-associated protein subunit delta [Lucilia sericata]